MGCISNICMYQFCKFHISIAHNQFLFSSRSLLHCPNFPCRLGESSFHVQLFLQLLVTTGNGGHGSLIPGWFFTILLANLHQNASCGSAITLCARAHELTALTSVAERRNVNCHLGYHLVPQTSSKAIRSWR